MIAELRSKDDVLREAIRVLTDRLPTDWKVRHASKEPGSTPRPDLLLLLTAPDGKTVPLAFEVKHILPARDVLHTAAQLAQFTKNAERATGVVVTRYLSPQARGALTAAGLSYIDATGNIRLSVSDPAIFLADHGADRDPWRGPGRPKGTLKGAPAAKIVRALADFTEPWKITTLADIARVSIGSTYRVIRFLDQENLVTRDQKGLITARDWLGILRRWSHDYGFVQNSRITRWIAPRGLQDLLRRAAHSGIDGYAVTGTLAAGEWTSYAPARAAMIYTQDASEAADSWGLRPAEAGANVILAEPDIDVVFTRTLQTRDQVTIAAPTQVAVDLMTGPGRSPAEAEELLTWMERNERSWRK